MPISISKKNVPLIRFILWTIGLGSEDVLIGFEPEEKRLDIGKNTILGNYNEFENNERFILNLINKMNEKFFIRST